MLTTEQLFFLEIMKKSVNDTTIDGIPEGINWGALFGIAKVHQMTALVSMQLSNFAYSNNFIKDNYDELLASYALALFNYKKRLEVLEKIECEFEKANIPFLIFKGTEIAQYYSKPEIRTMGDSDILVHDEDREKAHEILLELGLTNYSKGQIEWIYQYNNMEFELHSRLMYDDDIRNLLTQKDFMDKRWEYATNSNNTIHYHLNESYHFVFLLLHLRKHFLNLGVGFRQFMDLAIMIKKCDLNWEWIQNEIELLGLTEFSKKCFALCEKWFGIVAPIEFEKLENDFYENSTIDIFNNGIFGNNNLNNRDNHRILQLLRNVLKGKIYMLVRMIFPSYKLLKGVPKYKFLNGKPYLLPIVWIYRLSIFNKNIFKGISEINSLIWISPQQVKKRKEYLKEWALH